MERVLLSYPKKCSNSCLYCFEGWNTDGFEKLKDFKTNIIIYPSCDAETINDIEYIKFVRKCITMQTGFCVISLSTKERIYDSTIKKLNAINEEYENKAFIKVSISLSNKRRILELEPGTSKYEDRIDNLKRLRDNNIINAIIIKPILPFIPVEQYYEIIDDCSKYTDTIITGDLYISMKDPFYIKYIKDKYQISQRKINWIRNKPIWSVVETNEIKAKIHEYTMKKKLKLFNSDYDYLCDVCRNRGII